MRDVRSILMVIHSIGTSSLKKRFSYFFFFITCQKWQLCMRHHGPLTSKGGTFDWGYPVSNFLKIVCHIVLFMKL